MSMSIETPPRLVTHWTRILHRDLESRWRDADAGGEPAVAPKPRERRDEPAPAPFGARTPAVAGVLLLGFYVALYLTVSAVVRIFAHDDAVVARPAGGGADRPESASASRRTPMPPAPPIA